jgi:Bardet-Biedl syndrome 7 protein
MQASTPAAPVSLHYVIDSHDPHNRYPNAKEVLYGTDIGENLALLLVNGRH